MDERGKVAEPRPIGCTLVLLSSGTRPTYLRCPTHTHLKVNYQATTAFLVHAALSLVFITNTLIRTTPTHAPFSQQTTTTGSSRHLHNRCHCFRRLPPTQPAAEFGSLLRSLSTFNPTGQQRVSIFFQLLSLKEHSYPSTRPIPTPPTPSSLPHFSHQPPQLASPSSRSAASCGATHLPRPAWHGLESTINNDCARRRTHAHWTRTTQTTIKHICCAARDQHPAPRTDRRSHHTYRAPLPSAEATSCVRFDHTFTSLPRQRFPRRPLVSCSSLVILSVHHVPHRRISSTPTSNECPGRPRLTAGPVER